MRFNIGQEVVCVAKGEWFRFKKLLFWKVKVTSSYAPKEGDIVTVAGYSDWEHIYLNQYPCLVDGKRQSYHEAGFEPVMDIKELNEILSTNKTEA